MAFCGCFLSANLMLNETGIVTLTRKLFFGDLTNQVCFSLFQSQVDILRTDGEHNIHYALNERKYHRGGFV